MWIVAGEVDVWTAWQAGLSVTSTFGEGQGHLELIRELQRLGVEEVHIVLDHDQAGRNGTLKAVAAAKAAGLNYTARLLDGPDTFDINDLFCQLELDDKKLHDAMLALPIANSKTLESWSKQALSTSRVRDEDDALALNNYFDSLPSWPEPLDAAAFIGLPGEIVRAVEPETEADPAAILVQLLVAMGNLFGRGPYFTVGAKRHFLNLFVVAAGATAKARKGTALSIVLWLLEHCDRKWAIDCQASGLGSGEGLICAVRDRTEKAQPAKKDSPTDTPEIIVTDMGVSDKRLLVVEEEFASILHVLERKGDKLSAILRQAWDAGNLRNMSLTNPYRSTNAHISVIAHITKLELLACMSNVQAANGLGNRFLWACVRRSKELPDGGRLHEMDFVLLLAQLQEVVDFARNVGELRRDEDANDLWRQMYSSLTADRPGLLGALTARAEAQVMRLACLYSVFDRSTTIRREHLTAALAVWRYCEASTAFLFGQSLGNPTADAILCALRDAAPDGLSATEISNVFSGHKSRNDLKLALRELLESGLALHSKKDTTRRGRPADIWVARTHTHGSTLQARLNNGERSEKSERKEANSATASNSFASFASFDPNAPSLHRDEGNSDTGVEPEDPCTSKASKDAFGPDEIVRF